MTDFDDDGPPIVFYDPSKYQHVKMPAPCWACEEIHDLNDLRSAGRGALVCDSCAALPGVSIGDPAPSPGGAPVHTIAWTIEAGVVQGEVTCAAPTGSDCLMRCPVGCESWPCDDPIAGGPCNLVEGPCNAAEWFDANGVEECYAGPAMPVRDGAIDVEWSGDDYTWTYA